MSTENNKGAGRSGNDDRKEPGQKPRYFPHQQRHNHNAGIKKFEGRCDDLRGHIYDCADMRQVDLYVKTTEKIIEYAGKCFKDYPSDMKLLLLNLERPTIVPPAEPPIGTVLTTMQTKIFEKKIESFIKREETLEENIRRLYSLIIGKCSEVMKAKVKGHPNFEALNRTFDGLGLLIAIKSIIYKFNSQQYL